jgi:excisionase family DNA binding protein
MPPTEKLPKVSNTGWFLTPRQFADAVGLGRSTVQRWVDSGTIAAERTAGGHRRIPMDEAVRFIRASHLSLKDPTALGVPDLAAVDADLLETVDPHAGAARLREQLLAGEAVAFRGAVLLQFLRGESIPALFDDTITDAMREIGLLWPKDPRGILVEHRATEICIEAINQIRMLLPARRSTQPRAVGGAYPSDPFTLPSLMAATVVAAEGWRELNLGSNTPLDSLALAAEESHARLVWLSASVIDSEQSFRASVGALADDLATREAHLVVGGRAVSRNWRPEQRNVRLMRSMRELSAFAHGLSSASGRLQT